MFSLTAYGPNEMDVIGSTILGYVPGMTTPPRQLSVTANTAAVVTLPSISMVPMNPPFQQSPIPGCGGGFQITIRYAGGGGNVTVVTATGTQDTLVDAILIPGSSPVGTVVTLLADSAKKSWFRLAN
jgi:hypothetical protein